MHYACMYTCHCASAVSTSPFVQVLGLALFAGSLILAGMFSLESFVFFGSFSKDTYGERLAPWHPKQVKCPLA